MPPEPNSAPRGLAALDRTACVAVLLTPLLLLHAHGFAEAAIGVAGACFVARALITRDWRWVRTGWVPLGLAWWAWLVICSLPVPALGLGFGGLGSFVQALVTLRFLLFVAALEQAVLRDPGHGAGCSASSSHLPPNIVIDVLFQYATGYNLYGVKPQGYELTGPFGKPRAGPPLSRILLPALLPVMAGLLRRRGIWPKLGAYALLLLGIGVMVLIGQRMPLLLSFLGLLIAGYCCRACVHWCWWPASPAWH